MARRNAAEAGVDDRVTSTSPAAASMQEARTTRRSRSSASTTWPQPVEVLEAIRWAVEADGAMVMDEAVADDFTAPGDDLERIMYGFSLLVCLPTACRRSRRPAPAR